MTFLFLQWQMPLTHKHEYIEQRSGRQKAIGKLNRKRIDAPKSINRIEVVQDRP
jgi:hypothetical protein